MAKEKTFEELIENIMKGDKKEIKEYSLKFISNNK